MLKATALESLTFSVTPLTAVERLRTKYRERPVWGRFGKHRVVFVLSHDDACRILEFQPAGEVRAEHLVGQAPEVGEGVITGRQLSGLVGADVVRTLALLACDAQACATAVKELATGGPTPFLRACLVEAMRLWPRVPFLTRISDAVVELDGVRLAPGTRFVVPVVLLGPGREFAPWRWISAPAPPDLCSERELEAGQAALATLLPERGYELLDRHLDRLPTTLDAARLRFAVHRVGPAVPRATGPAVPRQRETTQAAASSSESRLTSDA